MTDPNYTDITVILDRSGSMQAIKKDMEGGYSQYLTEQRMVPGKCMITVIQFDTEYEIVHGAMDIQKAPKLTLTPRGGTALLDAMGKAITQTGERLAALPEDQRPGNVIIQIITDGQENSSREWKRDQVFSLVTEQTDRYGWIFSYLGANQDAIAVARDLGIPVGTTSGYTPQNAGSTFAVSSLATTRKRMGGTYEITEEEKALLNK